MRMVVTFDFDDTLLELAVKRDADGDIVDVHVTNREKILVLGLDSSSFWVLGMMFIL